MNIAMPELNGLEAAERVHDRYPHVYVIMLCTPTRNTHFALRAGASGYLLKDANAAELEIAVRAIARCDTYFSHTVSHQITDYVRRVNKTSGLLDRFTP